MFFLKMAWRNLWRNRRRTLITAGAIFFAVLLSTLMASLQWGSYDGMIKNTVGKFSGYVQVQQAGYWEEQTLDNSLTTSDSLEEQLTKVSGVREVVPRLESYVLVAGEKQSKAAYIGGVHPEKESHVLDLESQLRKGHYLSNPESEEVLLSEGLADYLKLSVGDTVVLLGSGYRGTSARGKYPICGIVKLTNPDLNKAAVFMPLKAAQYFFVAPKQLTALALVLASGEQAKAVAREVRTQIPDTYAVMSWEEMMPELVRTIEADAAGNYIILLVLYVIISFGIFGTVLMMVAERRYEFGVLLAVGMKRLRLSLSVVTEVFLIALLGIGAGLLTTLPAVLYLHYHPIPLAGEVATTMEEMGMEAVLYFSKKPAIFYTQALVVFLMCSLIILYPLVHIFRLNVMEAMRK